MGKIAIGKFYMVSVSTNSSTYRKANSLYCHPNVKSATLVQNHLTIEKILN